MSASQRLSRGFQRLGLFSSGILLISGSVLSLMNAIDAVNSAKKAHDDQVSLVCAQTALKTRPPSIKSKYPNLPPGYLAEDELVDVAKLGCSELSWTPTAREVLNASPPSDFSFTASFLPSLAFGLTATLAAGLLAYGVVRAIGWVIGGFSAS